MPIRDWHGTVSVSGRRFLVARAFYAAGSSCGSFSSGTSILRAMKIVRFLSRVKTSETDSAAQISAETKKRVGHSLVPCQEIFRRVLSGARTILRLTMAHARLQTRLLTCKRRGQSIVQPGIGSLWLGRLLRILEINPANPASITSNRR